ncbi:hypothetical protein [Ornithobacterium rhinotracheale]|uniref:hypothetical protein n=1 Tax=Ornithobacterium rhinotracheale TaxID=28251 RepID=UPI001FF45C43|nr:hypothetical protein [Ornithobacterium rhinotracheale]MCK0201401.1 hypothetical protein [Ornithobacterium rhinotracheale]
MNKNGHYSKSKITLTKTQETQKIEFDIPDNERENVTAGLIKVNHAKGLYDEFFTLNQQFLSYVLKCSGLKGREWEVFMWFMSVMDYGNRILVNQQILMRELSMTQAQVSKALKKLREKKIIIEKKENVAKYAVSFNYDLLNPQLAFKGKLNKQNVQEHKKLIKMETPYISQYNLDGNIDLINSNTGQIIKTISNPYSEKQANKMMIENIHSIEEE